MSRVYSFSQGRFLFVIVGYRVFVLRWDIRCRCPRSDKYLILSALALEVYLDPLNPISAVAKPY